MYVFLPDSLAKDVNVPCGETGLHDVFATSTGNPAFVPLLDKACSLENFYPLNSKNCGGDPVIFSANVYTHCSTFTDRKVLLDTCAAESVFCSRDLFYSIMPSATPMIINGVNPYGRANGERESRVGWLSYRVSRLEAKLVNF